MVGRFARTAPALWAAVELRRRWRALVVLGLLAGVTAGLATASVAGARRSESAWDRLRAETGASDAIVFASQVGLYDNEEYDAVAALPYVEASGAFGLAYAAEGQIFMASYGDWLSAVDRPRIIRGRAPSPDDPTEVVLSTPGPSALDSGVELSLGDDVTMSFLTRAQADLGQFDAPEGPTITFHIVGIGDSPFEIAAIPSRGDLYVGPAFRERYGTGLASFSNLAVRLRDPARDIHRLEADVARLYPDKNVPVYDLSAAAKRVTNGTQLERSGLLLFAGAVALAGLVIVGQALTRSVRAAGADVPVLVAIGFTRRDAARALALPYLLSAVVATVTSVVVAIALSPRFPIGLGRRVDPDVGLHVDLAAVAGGGLLVLTVLAAAVLATAWRGSRVRPLEGTTRSVAVSALLRMGAPVTAVTGASLALDRGRGRRALPTRPAALGAVAGVLGVIGAFTLAAGIGDAVRHPERFGAVWDVEVNFLAEAPNAAFLAMPSAFAADPEVTAAARVARVPVSFGEVVVPVYALDVVKGSIDWVVLDGDRPEHPGDIVFGPGSAKALHVGIGDAITLGNGTRFRVVGLGLLPTTPHSSFDQGAWVGRDDIIRVVPDADAVAGAGGERRDEELAALAFGYHGFVAARFADGVDIDAAVERISESGDLYVERPLPPADQQNLRNVRPLPVLFGVFSIVLAMGALAHVSASVVRRRRGDLAVLRALGCTPVQIRGCLAWQATILIAIGIVVGLPLGFAVGRTAWRLVTDATPMVFVEPLAVVPLLLAVPVAVLLANAVAAWPGHRAARLQVAEALRTE